MRDYFELSLDFFLQTPEKFLSFPGKCELSKLLKSENSNDVNEKKVAEKF